MKTAKCLASSTAPAELALGLIETGMFELVYPNIFSTILVEKGKPHSDIFLCAARKMDASPPRCSVLEDSVTGVTTAKSRYDMCELYWGDDGHSRRLYDADVDTVVDRLDAVKSLAE